MKSKGKQKAKKRVTDLPAKKSVKGGDSSTYTVSTHLRRIFTKLG